MADRDHNRRVAPAPAQEARSPQRRDISPSLPHVGTGAFPLELIDLDAHPDGKLLRACVQATKLRDRFQNEGVEPFRHPAPQGADEFFDLTIFIVETEALTQLGLRAKAIFAFGDTELMSVSLNAAPYASVVRDFLRMGVPA